MPKFLQKKAYIRRVTIKPNDGGQNDCFQQVLTILDQIGHSK